MTEGLTRPNIAYMHLYDRHLALFDRIAERHGRVAVASCVEDYPLNIFKRSVTIERHSRAHSIISLLYPVDQVAFVVGLLIDEMHVEPISLDLQQNLCHAF